MCRTPSYSASASPATCSQLQKHGRVLVAEALAACEPGPPQRVCVQRRVDAGECCSVLVMESPRHAPCPISISCPA